MPLKIVSERCTECGIGFMVHVSLYTYECNYSKCKFKYMIEPVSSPFRRGVSVLHKSDYNRRVI